jgi:predicted CXXCH cytochrome family protein
MRPHGGLHMTPGVLRWPQPISAKAPRESKALGARHYRNPRPHTLLEDIPTSTAYSAAAKRQTRNGTGWTWWCAASALQLLALIAVFGVTQAYADIHPVPLEKDTPPAKCLECHGDKAKGKSVHSAMALGCMACHEIRVNRDVTRVRLITATTYALCFTCHADKNPKEIKGTVHPPAVRDCLKCHDPHSSDNDYHLLKPTSGGAEENLCLECHTKGLNVPEGGSRHPALDIGCNACHDVHKTGDSQDPEFKFHLVKAVPALCFECHDVKDSDLAKAHRNQPFETANCLECHDPHQSDRPNLLQAFVHPPFADKQCDLCHQPAKDGKVVLTQATAKDLCVTCHADKEKQIEDAKVQHPGAFGDCTDCHSPHAGNSPGFPKPDAVNVCLTCHTEIAEEGKKSDLHQPVFQQGCAICHDPHGNDKANLLRVPGNALCLECHGSVARPQKIESEHVLTIFNGSVKLPEDYFEKNKTPLLPLKYGLGHPVEGHPVSDIMDPMNITKVKTRLSCLSCHQPHASAKPGLLVKDQEANMAFCDMCHKNRMTMGVQ